MFIGQISKEEIQSENPGRGPGRLEAVGVRLLKFCRDCHPRLGANRADGRKGKGARPTFLNQSIWIF
jgi:hypothetical protein